MKYESLMDKRAVSSH